MPRPGGFPETGFGAKLAILRRRKGWTPEQLAQVAGVHPNLVRQYEDGRAAPAWATVILLSRALICCPSEFLDRDAPIWQVPLGEPGQVRPVGRPRKKKSEDV